MPVKIKVWLDDVRPAPDGWLHVTTAEDAIALVETGLVQEISLDHDLGQEKSGYDVALWIEIAASTNPNFCVPKINVHSANPVGRQKIEAAIKSIERISQWDS